MKVILQDCFEEEILVMKGEGVGMYISEILEIENYRNLSGRMIKFDKAINFLIGENKHIRADTYSFVYGKVCRVRFL